MKIYNLNEAIMMHNIGIRMCCVNGAFPSFINPASIIMWDKDYIYCEGTDNTPYFIGITEQYSQWKIADDI